MLEALEFNVLYSKLEAKKAESKEKKFRMFVEHKNFKAACCLEQPIYSRQFPLGNSIYDTPVKCDFILHHPLKYPTCLVIESKWQESSGSTDEKYPYLVLNVKEKLGYPTIIVVDGGGYKPGAEKWLRSQVGGRLLYVFNMMEFQKWSNSEEL